MSFQIGTYTTAYFDGVTGPHRQALPLRMRLYGACAGHCACAMDWAALNELAAERKQQNTGDLYIGAYNHQTTVSYDGMKTVIEFAFGEYYESLIGMNPYLFLDPSWTPQDIDGNGWSLYGSSTGGQPVGRVLNAFRRTSWPITTNRDPYRADTQHVAGYPNGVSRTPRSLDEMLRLFYDMKSMYRIETGCSISYSESPLIYYERMQGGGEHFGDPGTVTLGADVLNVAQRVRETQGYGVREGGAAWAMVEMWCAKDAPQIYRPENPRRTLAVTCTLGGTLDTSRFGPLALKAWVKSVYGAFDPGHDYYAMARVAAVYADVNFPADDLLIGLYWEPEQ